MKIPFNGQFSIADLNATLGALGNDIFFLQVGAMDGVSFDPIHSFVKNGGWRGILVEPIPYLNKKLQENYAGCIGLSFPRMAIADYEGEIEMAYIDPTEIDPKDIASGTVRREVFGLSTIMQDKGIIGNPNIPDELKKLFEAHKKVINVPCCRLPTLLAQHQVSQLDLMVIDTEGADWMVARQLPLDRFRPRVVFLEYYHLSQYETIACAMHFRNNGYRIYCEEKNAENFLAVRAD